ncbi:MAG: L-2-amino-thiazoline-4-carboxylic acid hydrolase [Gaiellaceae bacterium]
MSAPSASSRKRWQELLGWLDGWFEPEKAETHSFTPEEREIFDELVRSWPGDDKVAALEAAAARFGREPVLDLIGTVCAHETGIHWAGLVEREGGSLDDLVRLLWRPLADAGFEFELQREPQSLRIHCTRCPHHDLALELGAEEWLYALVCATDLHVGTAFDPPIRFERTKTLMQGHGYCNHAYFVEAKGAPSP